MSSTCASCMMQQCGLPASSAAFVLVFGNKPPSQVWHELSEHAKTHPQSTKAMYCADCRVVTMLAHQPNLSDVMMQYAAEVKHSLSDI